MNPHARTFPSLPRDISPIAGLELWRMHELSAGMVQQVYHPLTLDLPIWKWLSAVAKAALSIPEEQFVTILSWAYDTNRVRLVIYPGEQIREECLTDLISRLPQVWCPYG